MSCSFCSCCGEANRLNRLLPFELQESIIIENKLQEAVKQLPVQYEDELLLTRFHTFQTSQQKVGCQIFFSHVASIFDDSFKICVNFETETDSLLSNT